MTNAIDSEKKQDSVYHAISGTFDCWCIDSTVRFLNIHSQDYANFQLLASTFASLIIMSKLLDVIWAPFLAETATDWVKFGVECLQIGIFLVFLANVYYVNDNDVNLVVIISMVGVPLILRLLICTI